ncbi:MipA/OmpV family protein [Marivita sp. S0852]|uniref:MipA/OmpV family protein n=1 Tax=Marivita sp. S0852 TaxID=3373893 RepID=UPI00398247C8
MILRFVTASVLSAALSTPALAAGPSDTNIPTVAPAMPEAASPRLVFTLRGGVSSSPEYFGSEDQKLGPDFSFRLNYLQLGQRGIGNPDVTAAPRVLSFGPSFRFISERDADDYEELEGLDTVDAALEVGVSVGYAREHFLAFAQVRRGFGGHEGWVAEAGADILYRPSDRWLLSAGPRVLFGDDTFTDTYFGVTSDEANATFSAYDPDGGLISAGIELGARYKINDLWGIEGAITYDVFQNDAADSPIVEQGTDEQWGVRVGITRVFSIGG